MALVRAVERVAEAIMIRGKLPVTFERILVPVDLSDRNGRALDTALALAQGSGARVTLLHVIHRVAGLPLVELRSFYARIDKTARTRLARAAKRFADAGLRVRTEVLVGEPTREIVRSAARRRVDLIVMGSHRVNPTRPVTGLGTTSYKVTALCACPILLVK